MSSTHTVVQGDHIPGIALEYGFSDYNVIWNHGNNADLKKKRVDPNVLFPGDQVFIPDLELRTENGSTDAKHAFKARKKTLMLRLVLEDLYEKPIANAKCELTVDSQTLDLTTDGKGKIEHEIAADAKKAVLLIHDPQTPLDEIDIPIVIGGLDPLDEVTGQQARLNNLGYFAGEVGGDDPLALRSAVEEFQCEHGLKVDGVCGNATQAKLKSVYGC